MGYSYRRRMLFFLVLFSGLLTGLSLPELLRMGNGTYAGFFSMYGFRKFGQIRIDLPAVFRTVASVRLQTLVFLWMSCYTSLGIWFHLGYAWWLAASGGMLLALFALRDGYQGLWLFFCCLLPQWFVYAVMWRREAEFLVRKQRGAYETLAGAFPAARTKVRRDLHVFAGLVALCLFGSAVESFLGLWTLKIFLQFFS